MLRYAGLWSVGLLCLLCGLWTVLRVPLLAPQEERSVHQSQLAQQLAQRDRQQLEVLYQAWKEGYYSATKPFIAFYAPEARLHQYAGQKPIDRPTWSRLVQNMQSSGLYGQVTDLETPQITVREDSAEIRAYNRYSTSASTVPRVGHRLLLCHKVKDRWLIASDWFPDAYQEAVAPRSARRAPATISYLSPSALPASTLTRTRLVAQPSTSLQRVLKVAAIPVAGSEPRATPVPLATPVPRADSDRAVQYAIIERDREAETLKPQIQAWKQSFAQSPSAHFAFYTPDARLHLPGQTLMGAAFRFYEGKELERWGQKISFSKYPTLDGANPYQCLWSVYLQPDTSPRLYSSLLWQDTGGKWLIVEEWRGVSVPYPWQHEDLPTDENPVISTENLKQAGQNRFTGTDMYQKVTAATPGITALTARYHEWQDAYAHSTSALKEFYAPSARISIAAKESFSVDQFCTLLASAHQNGTYDYMNRSVSPSVVISGNEAETRCLERNADSRDGAWREGMRRLWWHKENGVWRITRDWFPSTYARSLLEFRRSPAMAAVVKAKAGQVSASESKVVKLSEDKDRS